MNFARNYENVLNFVKVMPKILLIPFFWTWCIFIFYFYFYLFFCLIRHDRTSSNWCRYTVHVCDSLAVCCCCCCKRIISKRWEFSPGKVFIMSYWIMLLILHWEAIANITLSYNYLNMLAYQNMFSSAFLNWGSVASQGATRPSPGCHQQGLSWIPKRTSL